MKTTFLKLCLAASMLGAALLWAAPSARANVYATDIKLNGNLTSPTVGAPSGVPLSITFVLNQAATYGTTININSNGTPVRTLTIASGSQGTLQGHNTVTWDGNDGSGNPIAPGTYSVSITAAAASLGASWTQFTVNNKSNSLNSAYGLAINNNPSSPYYGRVFAGNKASGTSTPGLVCPNAIMKLNADCSSADEGLFGTAGATLHNNGYAPFGLRYDSANDLVYFLDFNGQGDLYACNMILSTNLHVLTANNYASNPHGDVRTGNGWHTFDVVGSGNSGMFFLGDADASGAGVYFWPMTNGVASGSSGTQVVGVGSGSSQISIADGGILVTTNDTVFVGQTIGNDFGDGGNLSVSSTDPAVEAFAWNGSTVVATADIWSADANNAIYQENWDIGLDSRTSPNYVAVPFAEGTSGNGGLQILYASNGTQVATMDTSREYWGVAFDGVGNVYGCESTAGYIRGYSPPGNSTNTTVAYGTLNITNEPPAITQQPTPANLTTNLGSNVTYTVTATGTPALIYQWTKNGTNLASQTTNVLALANLQTNDSGSYAVIVTNLYGSVTSSAANLIVAAAPVILQQPLSMWTYTNCSAGFSVTVSGSQPLAYQWRQNSAAVSGATNSSLVLSGVQFANAGSYTCVITNLIGSITSSPAALAVVDTATNDGYATTILQDGPMAYYRLDETNGTVAHDIVGLYNGVYNNVTLGESGFSCIDPATAAGFGPGTNSYVGNIIGIDGFASGADTNAFSLEAWVNGPASQTSGAGILAKGNGGGGEQFDLDVFGGVYRFFVRDSTGATPPSGTLTASVGPNGTWQHVVAVYDGPGGYLYLYINGAQVATKPASANGILTSTHEVDIGSRQSGSGAYDDNFHGSIDQVAVYAYALNGGQVQNHYLAQYNWPGFAPVICQEPQPVGPVYPLPSVTATFSVVAAGDPSFTYQWTFDGSPISGANASSYSIYGVQPTNAGTYSCAVTNNYGGLVSQGALLTVLPTNSYSGTILGDGPISYWRLDETNGTVAHDYWGGNNGVYNNVNLNQPGYSQADSDPGIGLPANPANRGYVQVANYSPFTFVATAQFTFEGWVNFTNLTGVQRLFSTMKTGTSPNGYGFGINGANELVFTTAGVLDSYESLTNGLVANEWYYLVCACDGANYNFYVDGVPVGTQPVTSNSGVGVPLQLGANPSGWPYSEQVLGYLDEMAIYNYALTPTQVANHWAARPLPVQPILQPVVILPSATNYETLSATLLENASGQSLSYQWYKGATLLFGETDSSLVLSPLQLADAGSYSVKVFNQGGSGTTGAVLTVWSIPTNAAQLNLTNHLVLHMPFDGDYTDISGRLHNGTNVGATTFVNPAAVGSNALSYSSTAGGPYNYVTLGEVSDLQFSSNIDFTVSYWVQQTPDAVLNPDLPFFTDAVGSTGHGGFAFAPGLDKLGNPTGGWGWNVGSVTVPGQYNTPNYNTINDGNWHHLVHVAQRNASCTTYLDGVQVDTTAIIEAGNITTANPVTIGQDPTGTLSLSGAANLDDLAVWTTTLSQLQVSGIFLAGATNHVSFAPVVIAAPTPTPVTISNIIGSTLTYGGGSGSQFILMTTNALVPPGSYAGWAPLGTNTATPGNFTIPTTGKAAFFYIQSK